MTLKVVKFSKRDYRKWVMYYSVYGPKHNSRWATVCSSNVLAFVFDICWSLKHRYRIRGEIKSDSSRRMSKETITTAYNTIACQIPDFISDTKWKDPPNRQNNHLRLWEDDGYRPFFCRVRD